MCKWGAIPLSLVMPSGSSPMKDSHTENPDSLLRQPQQGCVTNGHSCPPWLVPQTLCWGGSSTFTSTFRTYEVAIDHLLLNTLLCNMFLKVTVTLAPTTTVFFFVFFFLMCPNLVAYEIPSFSICLSGIKISFSSEGSISPKLSTQQSLVSGVAVSLDDITAVFYFPKSNLKNEMGILT